jgi:hypothetical protein
MESMNECIFIIWFVLDSLIPWLDVLRDCFQAGAGEARAERLASEHFSLSLRCLYTIVTSSFVLCSLYPTSLENPDPDWNDSYMFSI